MSRQDSALTDASALQLLRNRLPGALELDSDNFQDVMNAPHKPLVVITATAAKDKEQVGKDVTALARQWRDAREHAPVVFTWMDADKWGTWLKSMYGLRPGAGPAAVVASHHVRLVLGFCFFCRAPVGADGGTCRN